VKTPGEAILQDLVGENRLLRRMLDILIPPRCLGCRTVVAEDGALCPSCWSEVSFISPPQCKICGLPFTVDPGGEAICGACSARRPAFGRARAVFLYDEGGRRLVLDYKHRDRTHGAAFFAKWIVRAAPDLCADADVIVPVPLHWSRLFKRGYNQSALVGRALGKITETPYEPMVLKRIRRTISQVGLSGDARKRNVAGAFSVSAKGPEKLDGKRVLLVDDVLTTGATVEGCAKVLRKAGASGVDVVTLARVSRSD